MPITVKFFANFREAVGKEQEQVEKAKDVASLLEELARRFGDKLTKELYSPGTKKLRDTVNILVNGRGIRLLEGLDTPLKNGDVVAIFPPVSGGRLTSKELQRYSRQIIIPGIGKKGQLKLKRAHVFVAGLGGLGSPACIYLVAAGVGHLTIIDNQRVDMTNLNRQILHLELDVGRSKAGSAVEKLYAMNPNVKVDSKLKRITSKNVGQLIKGADVVVDGMDNYPIRYLLNEACVRNRIPFVHGAVEGLVGQLMTVVPGKGPCLKCLVPREPSKKPLFPVLGATPGVIGCLQAMETIKLITGVGEPLVGRMLIFNGADMTFDEMKVKRDPRCPVCGKRGR
ncbi:MAG: MoaD family protein [Hadesarchaea archaeon]|nr:MoaD family protein [Hadesarchaea archaeon]